MKTILFIASELPEGDSAQCADLSKVIYGHIDGSNVRKHFKLKKWDQPDGVNILNEIGRRPAYIQYCGHGNSEGDWQLPPVKGKKENLYSVNLEEIEYALENHLHLECLLLGSCNSDKWADKLQRYADFSIGFTGQPSADFVIDFYNKFYAHLVKNGSPLKAYWAAQRRIKVNKERSESNVIIRSKHGYIMNLIKSEERHLSQLKGKQAEIEAEIDELRARLEQLDEATRSDFEALLHEHPFATQVIHFALEKEYLSLKFAQSLTEGEDSDVDILELQISMLLDILQGLLLTCEERVIAQREARNLLVNLKGEIPVEDAQRALGLLKRHVAFADAPKEFKVLLDESIKYCLSVLKGS